MYSLPIFNSENVVDYAYTSWSAVFQSIWNVWENYFLSFRDTFYHFFWKMMTWEVIGFLVDYFLIWLAISFIFAIVFAVLWKKNWVESSNLIDDLNGFKY